MPTKLTTEILTAAIEGFEARKKRINAQIADQNLHQAHPKLLELVKS